MKVGIMQPYFFPHIAYFQLISAVDVYVNLDHVSFMKRSYMVRNRVKNNVSININVKSASQNKSCMDVSVDISSQYIDKFIRTMNFLYGKQKNYDLIIKEIIEPNFKIANKTVSEFNLDIIKSICNFLQIKTTIIDSSHGVTNKKRDDALIDIANKNGASIYINSIGGTMLYDKKYFKQFGIDLLFLKSSRMEFTDNNISILDLLFTYDKDFIINQINKYELI
jgi:hypothetical protein